MHLIDLLQPETNRWSYPEYKKIIFRNSDATDDRVTCEVELEEREVTLKARSGEVYAFLSRLSKGLKIFSGEYVTLACGDCLGFEREKGKLSWFLAFSEPRRLRRMKKETENLLQSEKTYFRSTFQHV